MSEIIRRAYERAITNKFPISSFMETEEFTDILERITAIFGVSLEDILKDFSLTNIDVEKGDEYMISWVIKRCLPANPLYQKDLVLVTSDLNSIHYKEKVYRVFILERRHNLRLQDPIWVWENKDIIDEFMAVDNPIYKKLKMIELLSPFNIIVC